MPYKDKIKKNENHRKWRLRNIERCREYHRKYMEQWRQQNSEHLRELGKKYDANPKRKEKKKIWITNNKNKIKTSGAIMTDYAGFMIQGIFVGIGSAIGINIGNNFHKNYIENKIKEFDDKIKGVFNGQKK